jgi:holliday junction DNA helicase RuvA
MISLIRGKVAHKALGKVTIDVHGIGYGVTVPLSTYYRLPDLGGEAELKIYTSMKDASIELFGFLTEDERTVFTLLIGVAGVGPRVATNILSSITPAGFVTAISSGGIVKRKIPGIGPKLASRLTTELRDKISGLHIAEEPLQEPGVLEDVVSALLNLGYKKAEIDEHVSELEKISSDENGIERALRESLKVMKRV